MTFEEYIKSDEGKVALAQTKSGMNRLTRGALAVEILCILVGITLAVFDALGDIFAENRAVEIATWCVLGVGVLFDAVIWLVFWRYKKQRTRFNGLLYRAITLYYAENPVPWETFAADGEMIVSVDNVFPDGYGAPRQKELSELVVAGGEGSCTLDMRLFRGALALLTIEFLCVSLFPFLDGRAQRGETFRTVRLAERVNGKSIDGKADEYLVKKGKLTRTGRALKRTVMAFSRYAGA